MNNKPEKTKACNIIHLLSFIDIIDRIDTLFLEIRHLQQNIIYSLRAPTLYLPLRYEEGFIFGNKEDNWQEWINNIETDSKPYQDSRCSRDWIIRYPIPDEAIQHFIKNQNKKNEENEDDNSSILEEEKRRRIIDRINMRVGKIWLGDDWNDNLRLQYNTLRALQILKQQAFRLKLSIIRAAISTKLAHTNTEYRQELPRPAFSILRQGVISQLNNFIDILGSHRLQIGQVMDFGVQSTPHPKVERRREIGIYMEHMTNRANEIQRNISDLLKEFGVPARDEKSPPRPLLFHSWWHFYKVKNIQLHDNVSTSLYNYGELKDKELIQHIAYINTSFWTPDRPDLQPIIAREVAVGIVRNRLGNLNDSVLSTSEDSFTELLISLQEIFFEYSKKDPETQKHSSLAFLENESREYLKILSYDFLAATVKGVSYLYALFLLRFGHDLENQLSVGQGHDIDLNMAYVLNRGTAPFEQNLLWYLQIKLVATWIRKTAHLNLTYIDKVVLDGCEQAADDLLNFLGKNRPNSGRNIFISRWGKMLEELQDSISKSTAVKRAKKWRDARSKDYIDEEKFTIHNGGDCKFSRTTRRLNIGLQNLLFRILCAQKIKKEIIDSEESITNRYNIKRTNSNKKLINRQLGRFFGKDVTNTINHPRRLFRHLYDIPFQCAVMRGIDILQKDNQSWAELLSSVHNDVGLGRDLFALALEFYIKDTESPNHRLVLCINLLSYQYNHLPKSSSIKLNIGNWLSKYSRKSNSKQNYRKKLKKISYSSINSKFIKSEHIDATWIAQALNKVQSNDTKMIRKLERLAGLKLKELYRILKDNNKIETLNHLKVWLSTREKKINKSGYLVCLSSKFYIELFNAFFSNYNTSLKEMKSDNISELLKIRIVSRMAFANTTPIPNPITPSEDPYKNRNSLLIDKILSQDIWKSSIPKNSRGDGKKIAIDQGYNYITLGKFDAIAIRPITIPCKCSLATFEKKENKSDDVYKEQFISHFSRREFAFQFDIDANFKPSNVFYISTLTLQYRSMRLNFLYDLWMLGQDEDEDYNIYDTELGRVMKLRHEKGINFQVLLSDGWNDVQILFSKEGEIVEDDLKWAFELQRTIFQDFMVDRTEMLLSPKCLNAAYNSKHYSIGVNVKIHKDGWLEHSINAYTKKLKESYKKYYREYFENIKIHQVPGLSDFRIQLDGCNKIKNGGKRDVDVYELLLKWMAGKDPSKTSPKNASNETKAENIELNAMLLTDRIETYIEEKHDSNECSEVEGEVQLNTAKVN